MPNGTSTQNALPTIIAGSKDAYDRHTATLAAAEAVGAAASAPSQGGSCGGLDLQAFCHAIPGAECHEAPRTEGGDGQGSRLESDAEIRRREEIQLAFELFDTDGDGTITQAELTAILTQPVAGGRSITVEEAERLFQEADLNGDGVLDYAEFSQARSELSAQGADSSFPATVPASDDPLGC